MKKWRKMTALVLSAAMGLTMLLGCSQSDKKETENTAVVAEAKQYNGQDVSKEVDLIMYVIGDEAKDEKVVVEELNKKLKEKINATIQVKHMSLSDYAQKYSLAISSGETIDMIYASSWAGYSQEATKGAFTEVSEEVIKNYMPLTDEKQPKEAFEQAKIGGKAYFVPANNAAVIGNTILIRGDLREKYGLEKLKNFDDLEAYYTAVAESEKGIYPYAASQNNEQMRIMMIDNNKDFIGVNGSDDKMFYYYLNEEASSNNAYWLYETQEYMDWIKKMRKWSEKGFWSKNAVANNTNPRDAFTGGTSASLVWNMGTCGAVASQIEKEHPEWKPEVYDLSPDNRKVLGSYTGDGMGVLAASKNQERAFMAIDLLKFDEECYNLVRLGIEGENWIDPTEELGEAGFWRAGERQDMYPFGSALSWAFKNSEFERSREDKFIDEVELTKIWKSKQENAPLSGFVLDDSKIKNEISNLNNIKTKYVPLLDLGLVDDVEETLKEFNEQAKAAGLDAVIEAYRTQVDEYLAKQTAK